VLVKFDAAIQNTNDMRVRVNIENVSNVFMLPAAVVDEHIKLAGAVQLKVLLCVFRHVSNGIYVSDLAKTLNLDKSDIIDALNYWIEAKILKDDSKSETSAKVIDMPVETPVGEMIVAPPGVIACQSLPAKKPTRQEVAARGQECSELKFLFKEVQAKFGRMITQSEAASLVYMHDYNGLPVPVILMMVEVMNKNGAKGMKYLEKMAVDWTENGIDSISKAEKYIIKLDSCKRAWSIVCKACGIDVRKPSKKESDFSDKWVCEWNFDVKMLRHAYDICVDSTGKLSLPYINKILQSWFEKGVKTINDAETIKKNGKSKSATVAEKSYDIDKLQADLENGLFGGEF